MNTRAIGMIASVFVFFAIGVLVNALFGSGMSVMAGGAAAYYTWQYFKNHDREELMQMIQGKEQTWSIPYNVAFGCVKDVLACVKMSLPGSGIASWQVYKEDDREGTIIALFSLQEHFASININFSVPVTLCVKFQLTPQGESTKVAWFYEAHCPLGTHRLKQAINLLEQSLFHTITKRTVTSKVAA